MAADMSPEEAQILLALNNLMQGDDATEEDLQALRDDAEAARRKAEEGNGS